MQYSNALKVVRAESSLLNSASEIGLLIRDNDHYTGSFRDGQGSIGPWAAKSAGDWGNSLKVSVADKPQVQFTSTASEGITATVSTN